MLAEYIPGLPPEPMSDMMSFIYVNKGSTGVRLDPESDTEQLQDPTDSLDRRRYEHWRLIISQPSSPTLLFGHCECTLHEIPYTPAVTISEASHVQVNRYRWAQCRSPRKTGPTFLPSFASLPVQHSWLVIADPMCSSVLDSEWLGRRRVDGTRSSGPCSVPYA